MYSGHDHARQRKLNPWNGKDRLSAKIETLENFPLYGKHVHILCYKRKIINMLMKLKLVNPPPYDLFSEGNTVQIHVWERSKDIVVSGT